MRILIDLDNTFTDYTGAFRDWMVANMNHVDASTLRAPNEYDFTCSGWGIDTAEQQSRLHRMAVKDGLYFNEKPMPNAMEAVKQLLADGHEIVFATARKDDAGIRQTVEWFNRHWFDPLNDLFQYGCGFYIGADKTLLDVDLVFEDRPETIRAFTAKQVPVVHPNHPYCRSLPAINMTDWDQAVGIVRDLEGE